MMQRPSDTTAAIETGEVLWPGAGRVHDWEVAEDEFVELLGGRRRFWIVNDGPDQGVRVGDLVAFYVRGQERSAQLFVVTLLWTHDGILAGWAIASLRPVRLTLGG